MTHRYVIGGVTFSTEENLPGLAVDGFADAELSVRFGDVEERPAVRASDMLRVSGPDDLEGFVDPVSMSCRLPDRFRDPERRAWHLRQMAPIFSTIVGRLVLHAGAVEIGGRIVGFVGAAGAGKSTLVRFLAGRGHRFVADDLLPVRFSPDAVAPVGYDLVPIGAIHFLRRADSAFVTIAPLDAVEGMRRLADNGFGEHGDTASWAFQFDAYHAIAESVPMFDLTIPDDHTSLPRVERALVDATERGTALEAGEST